MPAQASQPVPDQAWVPAPWGMTQLRESAKQVVPSRWCPALQAGEAVRKAAATCRMVLLAGAEMTQAPDPAQSPLQPWNS